MEDQKECEVLTYNLTVPNETTKIKISKLDFDTGLFVSGAKLAVYEAGFLDGVYTDTAQKKSTISAIVSRESSLRKKSAGSIVTI